MATSESTAVIPVHGDRRLPSVEVDGCNHELEDEDGFVGDRASRRAFRRILDEWRKVARRDSDGDPLGKTPTEEIGKKKLDELLASGKPEAAAVVQSTIEEFAQELAHVVRRFLKTKEWRNTERIVFGGGLRDSRVGELSIERTAVILKADKIDVDVSVIRNHPDDAGLIGAAHLAPAWIFGGHDSILAIDIGGTNIRAGVVELRLKKSPELAKACVWKSLIYRHADDDPSREEAVDEVIRMLKNMIQQASKAKLALAPFIGIGCPGVIEPDGTIARGAQNLPGNWEASRFNLPQRLREAIPEIDDHETAIVMHNDAVVQGLSEVPFMQDVERWGVLTIGTGLGNARFTNRR